MSQLQNKFLSPNAVTADKIQDGSITNAKVAAGIDAVKIADGSVSNTEFQYLDGVTSSIQTQLNAKIASSEKGAAGGVAPLNGSGKIDVAYLPNAIMEYQGTWNASTNSPSLADGVGNADSDIGSVYRVSVAGSQNLGSGSITFAVGDYVILNASKIWEKADTTDAVSSVNGQTGDVTLTTSNISEGSNLYFTDERAQDAIGTALTDSASVDFTYNDGANTITAAVLPGGVDHDQLLNFVANEHVNHASVTVTGASLGGLTGGGDLTASRTLSVDPNNATEVTAAAGDFLLIADVSDSNNVKKVTAQSIADLVSGSISNKQTFTLVSGDITNQYIDLAQVAKNNSVAFFIKGQGYQVEGDDYTVSYTGGAGGKTRITFAGDLATAGSSALIAGDKVVVHYVY